MADDPAKSNQSDATKALRYGVSHKASVLNETVPTLRPGDQKWILQPGGELLQVDRRGRPTGLAIPPVARLKAADGEGGCG